jgi:hypothetical protein
MSVKENRQSGHSGREAGSALLIAIFALMLISVVGIALLVSTGTDSQLAGNYRNSTAAYYAAVAGLEEARGRLLWKNRDFLNSTVPNFIPMAGGLPALGLTDVRYILNPAVGETVDPTSSTNPSSYPDNEYQSDLGWSLSGANVQTTTSVSSASGFPGPLYKWVRINPVTEHALQTDINNDGVIDNVTPLLYDPAHVDISYNPKSGLVFPTTPPTPTAVQALEITALAVQPDGSKRLLQYIVAPLTISTQVSSGGPSPENPSFPAALTLVGNGVSYTGPETSSFYINGQDECPGSSNFVYSIGYTNPSDRAGIVTAATPAANYLGYPPVGGAPPPPQTPSTSPASIANVDVSPASALLRPNWLTPKGLDAVVQDITKSADVVFSGNINGNTSLTPLGMNSAAPLVVVVNGNLDLTSWRQVGYGILLVTGTLTYDPDATWEGIVLVIGQGNFVSTKSGSGGIDGAVFIAKTRDTSGNLLPALGAASFSQTGGGTVGRGIYYSSCWITAPIGTTQTPLQGPLSYKVLSFREITQ